MSNLDKTNIVHKILTKSEEWEYEKEWRIFKIEKNEDPLVDGPIPKAIYMGCKIDESPELKNELLCYCKEFNVKLIQKVMKKNSFCLEDRELTLA